MMRIIATVLLAMSVLGGCKNTEAPTKTDTKAATVVASIERTACYGSCPIYRATFYSDGRVRYVGKRFVPNVGTFDVQVSADDVKSIEAKAVETGYFDLNDKYDSPVTDFPSCVTSFTAGGKSKSVFDRVDGPKSLKSFEKHLDSLLEGKEFKKVSEEVY